MKKITVGLTAIAALFAASGAAAQDDPRVDIITGTLSDVKIIGGIGPKQTAYQSASWTETLSIKQPSGRTVRVTNTCIGMGQPEGSLFDRHVACDGKSGEASGSSIMGCNIETENGNEMSCTGYFQGKTGDIKDHASLETAYYKFDTEGGGGTVQGTAHWIK